MTNYSVTFYTDELNVTVTNKGVDVHNWICSLCRIHHRARAQILVGIDTEWLPNLAPDEDHPVALLQLCVGNDCLIFQILHSDCIPRSLQLFLGDQRHVFCGVGVKDDVAKLYDHYGLRVGRIADLNRLASIAAMGGHDWKDGDEYKYMGLKKMALALLGKKMKKPLNVTMSNWDAEELNYAQIEYAAIDAAVSFQLGYKLCTTRFFYPDTDGIDGFTSN